MPLRSRPCHSNVDLDLNLEHHRSYGDHITDHVQGTKICRFFSANIRD